MAKAERLGKTNGRRAQTRDADLPNSEASAELKLLVQYIKDLSFESPRASKLKLLESLGQTSGLQTDVDVTVNLQGENTYEVMLILEITAKNDAGIIYHIETTYGGLFRLSNVPQDLQDHVLFVECPKLLFPFLRRVIADITHNGGFPPLMLDFGS